MGKRVLVTIYHDNRGSGLPDGEILKVVKVGNIVDETAHFIVVKFEEYTECFSKHGRDVHEIEFV